MTTSGTVGKTRLDVSRVMDKAFRRCGLNPAQQTPETVENALESLYMLIMSLANRGLNLWCVEKELFPLTENQARYTLPDGTQSLLNVIHCIHSVQTPELVTVTDKEFDVDFGVDTPINMIRLGFSVSETIPAEEFSIESSVDGMTYEPIVFEAYSTIRESFVQSQRLYWLDVKKLSQFQYLRISRNNPNPMENLSVIDFFPVIRSSEIQLSQFNRDDYSAQPTKTMTSARPTNFYFEKLVNPTITLWPIPNTNQHCLTLYRYRLIQDIGDLQNEIEIPSRWLEAITWHLALRLAFEVPGADGRIQAVQEMAKGMTIEVEGDETDAAPTYFQPNIRGYTR